MNIVVTLLATLLGAALFVIVGGLAYVRTLQKDRAGFNEEMFAVSEELRVKLTDAYDEIDILEMEKKAILEENAELKKQVANAHRCLELLLDHPLDRSSKLAPIITLNNPTAE